MNELTGFDLLMSNKCPYKERDNKKYIILTTKAAVAVWEVLYQGVYKTKAKFLAAAERGEVEISGGQLVIQDRLVRTH